MAPRTTDQYIVTFDKGIDGLELRRSLPIGNLGDHDCVVSIEAVSLNYRDVAMTQDNYPGTTKKSVIPCSDAAGTVIEVGPKVEEFKVGDKVCSTFAQRWDSGPITADAKASTCGGLNDGVLRKAMIVPDTAIVAAPPSLSIIESSTLPCAALTAWNALVGLEGKRLQPDQSVLIQGTGGVSLAAIQFALAIGAKVIATTSSTTKEEKLKAMGVQHVINYREDKNWGESAKKLSPEGLGVHVIVEVGGEATMAQSFKALRLDGVISIIGYLGGRNAERQTSFRNTFETSSVVRGINVGSRQPFKEMNAFIEEKKIRPVVDDKVFDF